MAPELGTDPGITTMNLKLPKFLTGRIGFAGLVFFAIGGAAAGVGLLAEYGSEHQRAYQGLLTFMVFPAIMTLGLGLILLAFLMHWRQMRTHGVKAIEWTPAVNLFRDLHGATILKMLGFAAFVAVGSLVFSFRAYEYTESREFCGTLCHQPMGLQYQAHQDSPHANVECVDCHVGPRVANYVKAKVSGLRQVAQLATDSYERPIRMHGGDALPAEATCQHCHWENQYWGTKMDSRARFGYDLENSRRYLQMYLNIGGSSPTHGPTEGIHHHMLNRRILFRSNRADKQEIAWIGVQHDDGSITEYDLFDKGERKYRQVDVENMKEYEFDCLDCHNRPAHQFLSSDEAVDRALELGTIDRTIPSIKKVAVEVLSRGYSTTEEALAGIESGIKGYYAEHFGGKVLERTRSLDDAVATAQKLFQRNTSPELNVTWNTYATNIGHRTAPGCFRCHGGDHLSRADGKSAISADCNLCHVFLEPSRTKADLTELTASAAYVHPFRHQEHFDKAIKCWDCHGVAASPYAKCADCHDKEVRSEVMTFECSTCHQPGRPKVAADSCLPCHPIGATDQHRTEGHGDCMTCHEPHQWRARSDHSTCAPCHDAAVVDGWGEHFEDEPCPVCQKFGDIGATLMGLPPSPHAPKPPADAR